MNKKGEWEVKIKKIENGYIAEWEDEYDEGGRYHTVTRTFEEEENAEEELSERKAMAKLIWWLMEYFGIYHSKHNKYNLVVSIKNNKQEENQ
jgi:hypothetical protein